MDGPSTLKEIRKKLGPIPVIVHTGYPHSELMQRTLESSPFTLLAKPCPPNLFVETVRRICHDHELLPQKNKCLPANAGARRVKPIREQASGTKIFTQIKRLLTAEDNKVAAGIKASNGSGHPTSIRTAQRKN
jgi:DNA-binding NtrC family response regulator